ncbi:MAG: MFS transporter [Campylobacterales bacterium]|nr:MFS transporter [Campylobacterales bacterium]
MNLPRTQRLLYALPGFSLALLGLPLYIYLPTFYVSEVGIGIATVGVVLLLARLIDMLADPFIGYYAPHWRFFGGGYRAMMLLGAAVLLGAFYALIHPQGGAWWLFGASLLTYLGWSMVNVPYLAQSALLSHTPSDQTALALWRELLGILGVIVALGLLSAQEAHHALALLWLVVALALPPALLLNRYALRISFQPQPTRMQHTDLARLWHTPKLRRFFAAYLLSTTANAIPATLFLLFLEHVIGAPQHAGWLLLLYFLSGVTALWIWNRVALRWGKERAWIASMALSCLTFVWAATLGQGDLYGFVLICLLSGLSVGADMALPAAINADTAGALSADGKDYGGLLFGFFGMCSKLALSLGVGIAFGVLGLFGFDEQSAQPLWVLIALYALAPVAIKLGVLWLLR